MTAYITTDTGETVHHTAPHGRNDEDGYSLDGYDWMDAAAGTGWHTVGLWGKDGWDCGQFPYVILTLAKGRDEKGNFYGVTTYTEGDLTTKFFRSQAAQWEHVSRWCHWNWIHGQGDGPEGLPEKFEDCGPEIRRPYGDEYDEVFADMVKGEA